MTQDELREKIVMELSGCFHSPHPENNLVRAREWMRIHQKELDIILALFQPAIKQAIEAHCGECDKWLDVEWQKQNLAKAIEKAREGYVKLANLTKEQRYAIWRQVELSGK